MSVFWDAGYSEPFVQFSPSHWAAIAITIALAALLYAGRHAIRANRQRQLAVRGILIAALLIPEAMLNFWYVLEGTWDVKTSLPLELCSITLILSIVMLAAKHRLLYQVLFFTGIGGALLAILTPTLSYPFPHFIFWHFFIGHGAIILSSLYMTWFERCKPTWRSIGITMLFLNVLAGAVWLVNYYVGANYMFLMRKPPSASILDWFGPYPYYLLAEEAIALLIFVALYAAANNNRFLGKNTLAGSSPVKKERRENG